MSRGLVLVQGLLAGPKPHPSGPQEHSFIKRYEMLEVDVASWFKDVMAKTESPRTSGVLSQHHLPFFR